MRVIVFFDLPTETGDDKRQYRKFRKFLIQKGFLMMQESVYCKLALNTTVADSIVQAVLSLSGRDAERSEAERVK